MSKIDELEGLLNSEKPVNVKIMPNGSVLEVEAEVPANSLRKAWNAYTRTSAFQRSKGWALHIQSLSNDENTRRFELMPFEQRERHVEGALWAAFLQGFMAARAVLSEPKKEG